MPLTQTQLDFPVRKSSRLKGKHDKENDCSVLSSNPTHRRQCRQRNADIPVCPEHEKGQTNLMKQESTPRKVLSYNEAVTPSKRTASKSPITESSPNKRQLKHTDLDPAPSPLSPSKHFNTNEDNLCSGRATPSARKQLPLGKDNRKSPRKLSRLLFDMGSPSKRSPWQSYCTTGCREHHVSPGKLVTPMCDVSSPSKYLSPTNHPQPKDLVTPSARKQLPLAKEHRRSPKKLSRLLFDIDSPSKRSPSKSYMTAGCKENRKSPRKLIKPVFDVGSPSKHSSPANHPQSKELFSSAKYALNTQQPDRVVCRDREIGQINDFLDEHISLRGMGRPGSLYISGAPGTGKTAVIKHLLEQRSVGVAQKVFINSMTVKSPLAMYKTIAVELIGPKAASLRNTKSACSMLHKHLTTSGGMVLLVLDEMDQLDSKNQEVLYTIFEWPSLLNSRLVLIGIANALDLTDRILPRLSVRAACKPQLLHFTPYTKEQILAVLESRLQQSPGVADHVLDKSAMLFCARKVSAVAGDMRKALDICRRSVELFELSDRRKDLLQFKGGSPVTSPATCATPSKVGIAQVARVVDEVYGSASTAARPSTFPLQQKLIACTVLLLLRNSKLKELALGKVHDAYCKVCRRRDVAPTDQSEFICLCQLLETRGLISLKKAKETRLMKISLKLNAKELEFALKDKLLISSILETGL